MWFDKTLGREVRVASRGELLAQKNLDALRAQGVDPHDVHCSCCGLRLTDLRKIKVSSEGAIGPECSKPGHVFPCRHARTVTVPPGDLALSRELSGLAEVEGEIKA